MEVRKKGCVGGFAGIGIDIGPQTFHSVGFDGASQLVRRRQISALS